MKEQLVQVIDKKDLQVLILTDGYNIHHLSGYRGHTGMLVAFQGEQYILTDSRYTEQVELEAPEFTCVDIGREGYSKTIAAMVQKAFARDFVYAVSGFCRYICKRIDGNAGGVCATGRCS